MRLQSLRIENFRPFRDATIRFSPYTCLVGQNGAGKSAILAALNVLFRNVNSPGLPTLPLTEEDFFQRGTSRPISITATFGHLSMQAEEDFKAYVRQGTLVIKATASWSTSTRCADVRQVGLRRVHAGFAPWFEANSAGVKAAELRALYASIRAHVAGLADASTKAAMETALRAYEEAHPEECELVESEDQFYGWSRGANLLRKHIEWVFIPAVKDASTEQLEGKTTALGELIERSIRQRVDFESPLRVLREEAAAKYQGILEDRESELRSLSSSLEDRLRQWSHKGAQLTLHWNSDRDRSVVVTAPLAKVAVGEGSFVGELCRLGHGLQRSFLVAVLQELTESDSSRSPTLLLGFEEPELYQHPPQARYLAALLERLAAKDSQVIVTTHSPYFVAAHMAPSIRLLRRESLDQPSKVADLSAGRLTKRLADALGGEPIAPSTLMASLESILQPSQNELFFCRYPVLVEGPEDVAYLATYLKLTDRWEQFRSAGGHFVAAAGKTNLSRPLAVAQELGMPVYVVVDGDGSQTDPESRKRNERDNRCILNLLGLRELPAFPEGPLVREDLTMWPDNIRHAVRSDYGASRWDAAQEAARNRYELFGLKNKNFLLVVATLEELWQRGERSAVLDRVTASILDFAIG